MNLVGEINFSGEKFPIIKTSFTKGTEAFIILREEVEGNSQERTVAWYDRGGKIEQDFILGMASAKSFKVYGSTTLIELVQGTIESFRQQARLNSTETIIGPQQTELRQGDQYIHSFAGEMSGVFIQTPVITIRMWKSDFLSIKPRTLGKLLEVKEDYTGIDDMLFLDSSLESLELRGFDTAWYHKVKHNYHAVHTMDDINNKMLPHLERVIQENRKFGKKTITTIDFESNGLEAWDEKVYDHPSKAVFLGISFEDDTAYGLFLDMVHFPNLPKEVGEVLNNLFYHDLLEDREITLPSGFTFKRSELYTTAHNAQIDKRFGLTVKMDFWFNLCSLNFRFNADPYLVRGHNTAKDLVMWHSGVKYAELEDICGKRFVTYFNRLTDLRVIMMYGCADVDLVRQATIAMLDGVEEHKDYFETDLIKNWHEIDEEYINLRAGDDFLGWRVDKPLAQKRYDEGQRLLNLYSQFMGTYLARYMAFSQFRSLVSITPEDQLDKLIVPDLDKVVPYKTDKWSGDFLKKVLFEMLDYKILVYTKDKSKDNKKKDYQRKPAIDTDAVKTYLKVKSLYDPERIKKALENPTTFDDLHLNAIYIKEDFVDPQTGKVLIEKAEFNSKAFPFFLALKKMAKPMKEVSSDYKPLVELSTNYRFDSTKTASIVTGRTVNKFCTVSKTAKDCYLSYSDEYTLIGADQRSVELKVGAGLSGDLKIIAPLNNPEKDPHTEAASLFFQVAPHLVSKSVRKSVKPVNFGRIYEASVRAICSQLFEGEINDENMLITADIIERYDTNYASIHEALNFFRDMSIVIKEQPEWIKNFFGIPAYEERINAKRIKDGLEPRDNFKYGFMKNTFGRIQHADLDDSEGWMIPRVRRKSGNFAVQGFCAMFIRKLYVRLCKRAWKKGWIQNKQLIIHGTVYDEIVMSVHKSVNMMELVAMLRESFVVRYPGTFRNEEGELVPFPVLFLGVNITNNWGDTKDDAFDIPDLLLQRYQRQFKAGEWDHFEVDNLPEYFLRKNHEYYSERILQEIITTINKGNDQHFDSEEISGQLTSYYVRGILGDKGNSLFKIKDYEDPVETMTANLVPFLAKELDHDFTYTFRDKTLKITKDFTSLKFKTQEDFVNMIPIMEETEADEIRLETPQVEDLFDEVDDDYIDFDIDYDNGEEYKSVHHIDKWDMELTKEYYGLDGNRIMYEDPALEKLLKQQAHRERFKNFHASGRNIVIKTSDPFLYKKLITYASGKKTTSMAVKPVYMTYRTNKPVSLGKFTEEMLKDLDQFISGNLVSQ